MFDYNKFTQPTFLGQVRIQLLPSAELPFTKTSTFTLSNSKPQSMRSSSSSSMAQLATPVSGEIDIGVELSRREILPEAQFDGNTQNQLNTATSISAGELLSNTDLTDENAPALPSREQSIDHSESSTSQHRYRQKAASAVKQISSAGLSASKIVASNLSNKFQQWKSSKQQN